MVVEDLIIEVRDPDLTRIGQFMPEDLVGAVFVLRYNNVGTWEMKLPFGHRLGEFLRLPGYGLIVTGPGNSVILSGPTMSARLEQTSDNLEGDWVITGATDDILLQERLAYPTPTTASVTNQTSAYDIRTGPASTVLYEYVSANIGPTSPTDTYELGPVVKTNLIPFSTISANSTRFITQAGTGGSETTSWVTDSSYPSGVALRRTITTSGSTQSNVGNQTNLASSAVVTAGQTYTFSAFIKSEFVTDARILLAFRTSANTLITPTPTAIDRSVSAGVLTRLSFTATAPAGAVAVGMRIFYSTTSATSGQFIDFTSWLIEEGSLLGTYFDGDTPDDTGPGFVYDWTGTAQASTSTAKILISNNDGRRISGLVLEPDTAIGLTVTGNARFDHLQELFYDLAQLGGIGYQIEQESDELVFKCYLPTDRSGTVRMDMDNQKLSSAQYSYASAKATRVIVGGQGEDEWRRFVEASSTESEDAENTWGRRIEVFKDNRNSRDNDILDQAGQELLIDQGKTIVEMSVTPSDDINMRFGVDWYLGDKVTIVVQDIEAQAVVTEIGLAIAEDGVRIGATVGAPIGITYESKLLARTADVSKRVGNLERTITGYGINTPYQPSGGTDGTQPTWTGNPITGSFNRFGNMVHFNIFVDFDTITSFGTGRYFLTLPYPSLNEIKFADGCLHDPSTGREYQMRGGVLAGSDVLKLSTTGIVGQTVFDAAFTATAPVTLTTEDYFHIAGTYEIEG